MKIALISFGIDGWQLAKRLQKQLSEAGEEAEAWVKSQYIEESIAESLGQWTERQFRQRDAVIFIGACGIAVRAIAPFIKSKAADPAVLVVDESGKYVISLLSGHLGGANELTLSISRLLAAIPVITTATDGKGRWAVDLFAKENDCEIKDAKKIKIISAGILAAEKIGFFSRFPYQRPLPAGLYEIEENGGRPAGIASGVVVSPFVYDDAIFFQTLRAIPRCAYLGIGCKKGISKEMIEITVTEALEKAGLDREAICGAATIDLKKEERALLDYCREKELPLKVYTADQLKQAPGEYCGSAFVKEITGVDNVCERSAFLAAFQSVHTGETELLLRKYAKNGVTAAIAIKKWSMKFE